MSCIVCSKPSTQETECCGRVYCGQECLASNLADHDIMCIEAINPLEWVRLMRQDMSKPLIAAPMSFTKPDEIILFVYRRKETRDQRFKKYMKAVRKNERILTQGSDQVLRLSTEAALNMVVRTRSKDGYWFIRSN